MHAETIDHNRVLKIPNAELHDSGTYRCRCASGGERRHTVISDLFEDLGISVAKTYRFATLTLN